MLKYIYMLQSESNKPLQNFLHQSTKSRKKVLCSLALSLECESYTTEKKIMENKTLNSKPLK